jgi:outer membrane receptor for ferrienterochelin and colicin
LRTLIAVLTALATVGAHALTGPAQPPAAQAPASAVDQSAPAAPVQEVVITGSRIAAPNLTSTSPIQVVNSAEIRQTGTTDIIDLLNTLPQNFQSAAADFSNTTNPLSSAGGLTTADLRGLGPQRTLVLVDGLVNCSNPLPSSQARLRASAAPWCPSTTATASRKDSSRPAPPSRRTCRASRT